MRTEAPKDAREKDRANTTASHRSEALSGWICSPSRIVTTSGITGATYLEENKEVLILLSSYSNFWNITLLSHKASKLTVKFRLALETYEGYKFIKLCFDEQEPKMF